GRVLAGDHGGPDQFHQGAVDGCGDQLERGIHLDQPVPVAARARPDKLPETGLRRPVQPVRFAEPAELDELPGMPVQGARGNGAAEVTERAEVLAAMLENGAVDGTHGEASVPWGSLTRCPELGVGRDWGWETAGTLGIGSRFPACRPGTSGRACDPAS